MSGWIWFVSCLVLSFILSGLESAILSMSRARLRHAAKEGDRRAGRIERLLGDGRERLLIAILVINAAVNLAAFAILTNETVNWLGTWGYFAAFAVSLPVYLIWIELLPKSICLRFPIRTLSLFLPLLWSIRFTVQPVITLLAAPAKWIIARIFGAPPAPPGSTREEFRALTGIFERQGTLDPAETRMIRSVLDFAKVRVGEVMMPLSKVTAVPREMPLASVVVLARKTDFDQFPVIGTTGDLVGLVDVLELLREAPTDGTVADYLRDLVRTLPGESAIGAVKRLRQAGHQLAAVYNPAGRPLGVVSVEDMVARMVHADC